MEAGCRSAPSTDIESVTIRQFVPRAGIGDLERHVTELVYANSLQTGPPREQIR